jgi:hypothetical protein
MAPHAENVPIEGSSPYPARSSSYRVYSVIDAYGGDSGIQFSPTLEETPRKISKRSVRGAARKPRSKPLTYDEIDESYGSDMDIMAAIVHDEYDPFRPISPVPANQSKEQRDQLVQKIYDRQVSQDQIDEFVKVRETVKEKALPPMPKEEEVIPNDERNRKRTDSAFSSGGPGALKGKTFLLFRGE